MGTAVLFTRSSTPPAVVALLYSPTHGFRMFLGVLMSIAVLWALHWSWWHQTAEEQRRRGCGCFAAWRKPVGMEDRVSKTSLYVPLDLKTLVELDYLLEDIENVQALTQAWRHWDCCLYWFLTSPVLPWHTWCGRPAAFYVASIADLQWSMAHVSLIFYRQSDSQLKGCKWQFDNLTANCKAAT